MRALGANFQNAPPTCPDVSFSWPTCPWFGYLTTTVAKQFVLDLVSNSYMSTPYINETILGLQTFIKAINTANPSDRAGLAYNVIQNIEDLAACPSNEKFDSTYWDIPWPTPVWVPPGTTSTTQYNHFLAIIFKAAEDNTQEATEMRRVLNWQQMKSSSIPGDPNRNAYVNIASIRSWAGKFSTYLTKNLRHHYGTHPNTDCSNGITVNIPQDTQVINKNIINLVDQKIFPVNPDGTIRNSTIVCANLNDNNTVQNMGFDASGHMKAVSVSCPPGLGMNYLTGTCNVRCDCFGTEEKTVCYSNDGSGSVCKPQIEEGCPIYNQMDSSGVSNYYPYMATI